MTVSGHLLGRDARKRHFLGSPPPAASLCCPKVGTLEQRADLPTSWGKRSPRRRCSILVT